MRTAVLARSSRRRPLKVSTHSSSVCRTRRDAIPSGGPLKPAPRSYRPSAVAAQYAKVTPALTPCHRGASQMATLLPSLCIRYRTASPAAVSRKRHRRTWPETFREFSSKLPTFGARRRHAKSEISRILQGFRAASAIYLRLIEWLAGDAVGFEPVSTQNPC